MADIIDIDQRRDKKKDDEDTRIAAAMRAASLFCEALSVLRIPEMTAYIMIGSQRFELYFCDVSDDTDPTEGA